ncbi:MAG TPA: PAS domain-containing sensor histidine kinase [Xanthobacteraceae bacterium]|nr:PAS domain-containing sensor histidine kinase [Xanthobacteraceae bacterium]
MTAIHPGFWSDPRLAAHATSTAPAWLWSADATRVLWANAVGAAIFDATPAALRARPFEPQDPAAAQVLRLAASLRPGGAARLERLRGFGTGFRLLMCACSRIAVDGQPPGILVVAVEPAGPALPLAERVRRVYEGADLAVAAFSPDGTLIHATPEGHAKLGGAATLAALGAERMAQDALATGRATGDLDLGPLTIERLGADATSVLAATFGVAQPAPADEPVPIPPSASADAPAPDQAPPPAPEVAPLRIDVPVAERRHPLRFVWQMDQNGRFTLGSDEFTEVIGPRIATTMGRPWADITRELALDPEDQVARAVATRDTWSGITVSWPVDGSADRLKVELSGLPIYDRNRNFLGYRGFGVCRDVDRIAALAVMRRSAAQRPAQPAATDGAPAAPPAEAAPASPGPTTEERPTLTLVPSSPNVVPFRSNAPDPKAPALSSVERSAFHELARQLTARLKGEDDDDDEAASEPAAQASHESQVAHPANNENAPPAEIAQPAPTGDDRPTAEAAELRLAQAQMRELKAILDTATDGVVVIEPDGRIVSCSRGAEALFGFDAAALTVRGFAELFAPESRGVVLDYLASLGRGERPREGGREVTGRARQGGTIPLFMTLGRIDDSPRVCAVFRDIAPWKKAERDLMAARHDAEKASAAKSDFLAKISHEIRTPLNSIIGFSEVMIEERFGPIGNERYREYLGDIRSSGGHVVALLNDLLDLSKLATGKLELAFASLNLNEVVQGCVALVQPQANRERIIIRTSLSPSLRPIVADARSVRQIVLNLLSNSINFTGAGGQVIVSTAQTAAGEVVLRVRDTGIGMDDNELAVALEPFRQLATSARWGSGGTGLGLPLTKALTEANRASFGISSKLNDGTLIEIAFPPPRAPAA